MPRFFDVLATQLLPPCTIIFEQKEDFVSTGWALFQRPIYCILWGKHKVLEGLSSSGNIWEGKDWLEGNRSVGLVSWKKKSVTGCEGEFAGDDEIGDGGGDRRVISLDKDPDPKHHMPIHSLHRCSLTRWAPSALRFFCWRLRHLQFCVSIINTSSAFNSSLQPALALCYI